MNVSLHIERLVVDERLLARADRAGLAQVIEREMQRRLAGSGVPHEATGRDAPPAYVQAIGESIIKHIPPGVAQRPASAGSPR